MWYFVLNFIEFWSTNNTLSSIIKKIKNILSLTLKYDNMNLWKFWVSKVIYLPVIPISKK